MSGCKDPSGGNEGSFPIRKIEMADGGIFPPQSYIPGILPIVPYDDGVKGSSKH
jgi:hypothetical protein